MTKQADIAEGTRADALAPDSPSAHEPSWPRVDRRKTRDRRREPTRSWHSLYGLRRRRAGRRKGETDNVYVDAFHASDIFLLVGIFLLNIFDALFTLLWLDRGGSEGNPVMNALLESGDHVFLIQKCFVVGLWLIFLMVHKNFRFARLGLYSLAAFYGLVILYHFVLIASGVDPRTGEIPSERAARLAPASAQASVFDGEHRTDPFGAFTPQSHHASE